MGSDGNIIGCRRRKLGNHSGYRRSRLRINGKCHDGALLGVDWSDQIDCFNLRMGLGLARSSISKSVGSSNTDLRESGSDMMIQGYVLKAVWMMIVERKMEIHGIGSRC